MTFPFNEQLTLSARRALKIQSLDHICTCKFLIEISFLLCQSQVKAYAEIVREFLQFSVSQT